MVLAPLAGREFQRQLFKILQTRAVSGIKERVFNTTFPGITIYVEEVSPSQMTLRGVLLSDERNPKLSRIITAREGRLLTDEDKPAHHPAPDRRSGERGRRRPRHVTRAAEAPPPSGSVSAARYRYARFAVYDMALPLDSSLGSMRTEKPETGPHVLRPCARSSTSCADDPAARAPFLVEWHKRVALPVAAVVFAVLGFPLAVRSHRGGRSIALVGSLVILVSYYLLLTTLEGSALRLRLPVCAGHLGPQRAVRRQPAWPCSPSPPAAARLVNWPRSGARWPRPGAPARPPRSAAAAPASPGAARIHPHHRPLSDPRVSRLHGGRTGGGGRPVRRHRSPPGARPVPAHQALDRAHPRAPRSTGCPPRSTRPCPS